STKLLYSGPYNVVKTSWGSGNFSLTWRPSVTEAGQSHPICFVAQANVSGTFYHSDLRCVIVTVGNTTTPAPGTQYVIALDMQISTTLSLENDSDTIITLIKKKLIEKGLPSTITVRLLSSGRVAVTTART
ncbi:hypothetical protein ILYODFUR_030578, partial [Ilyodon furcidens]